VARPFLLNEEREMYYFITSQENPTPSAIEIAQMQRVHYW
jgi:poly(glycerol-phosphate) alpha-glucosyltransferase